MRFEQTEVIFYAAAFLAGAVGGISRHWRDGRRRHARRVVGGCLSSGLLGFGVIGFWIGRDPTNVVGPFYYLAIAALTGYLSEEIQTQLINRATRWVVDKFGLGDTEDGSDDDSRDQGAASV